MVLNNVKQGTGSYGYNAATGEYGDMIAMGILDPTKVTRTALQNAASIAGLMITTEAMVAEAPKKDEPILFGKSDARNFQTARRNARQLRELVRLDYRKAFSSYPVRGDI